MDYARLSGKPCHRALADADWYLDDDPAEAYNNLFAVINILFSEENITEDTRRYIFDNIRRMGNAVHAEQAVAIKEEYKRFCEKKVSDDKNRTL